MLLENNNVLLDNIGYVKFLQSMGDEFTPAEDARTSTGKGRLGAEKDSKLQLRMLKDKHTSPFEGIVCKFEMCIPLFVLREMDRHRTCTKTSEQDYFDFVTPEESLRKWFSRNEMSGRYIQLPDQYYIPKDVRGQSKTNNQGGSQNQVELSDSVKDEFKKGAEFITRQAREFYDWAVNSGVEKGLARIVNTQNQYVVIRLTGSLKNWLDMLNLRDRDDVLWEKRQYAIAIRNMLQQLYPSVLEQWNEHIYNSVSLTHSEVDALKQIFQENYVSYINRDLYHSICKKIGLVK